MGYPPPPWLLKIDGVMLQTLHLLDAEQVRKHIPSEFELICYGPKTVGGIYYAHYGPGSTVEYNELGVFLGFVRFEGLRGAWITNMYVDSDESVEMAHDELGLPKEKAEFIIESGPPKRIIVHQNRRVVCALAYSSQIYGWRQRIGGDTFGLLGRRPVRFRNDWRLRWGIARAGVGIGPESPIAGYGLDRPLITFCGKNGTALLGQDPQVMGKIHSP